MAKSQPGQFLVDGIGPLDAGVNTGLAPQLLPSNQVAMSTNMTFRGGYGNHRPSIREISLDFKGDATAQELCIHRAFQGACFYQPDTGAQSLVAAIGGHLFQFFPSGITAQVLDVSVAGDPNPVSPQQAWLWQSERFVIWNDGVSLPVFFDGSVSRRSNGPNKILATISGFFVSPAVGATVSVAVNSVYNGPFNIPVLVNGFEYTLLSVNTSAQNAQLTLIYDPATHGSTPVFHVVGEQVIAYANRIGTLLQDIPQGTTSITALTSNLVDVNNNPFNVHDSLIQLGNRTWFLNSLTPLNDGSGRSNAKLTLIRFISNDPGSPFIAAGTIITIVSSAPNPTVGTVAADFTPGLNRAVGSSFDISITPAYTGPPVVVWVGSGQYLITAITPSTSSTVILQNVSDTAGHNRNGNITGVPELPAGRMGTYGLGRNWMALTDGFSFIASDIVGGTSGTAIYNFRDAPLRITENTYLAGGGAFRVPGALGDIRAMKFSATLDVSLGQGPLQVFTTQAAFSCNAPVDRTTWATITNPILTQSLLGAGALSQSGTVNFNSDILFRAIDGTRSLILARRDFDTWGNVPQSREVETILAQDNATLVQFESIANFDNRALLTVLPTNGPLGVFHQGIIALNADPISTLRGKAPSIYDGLWTGMNVLQLVTGTFDGVERCYAFCFDSVLSRIRLFEIQKTDAAPFDNANTPVTYSFESASLFKDPKIKGTYDLAELVDGEVYISDLRGVANFEVWYRPNYSDCWTKWTEFGVCGNNTNPTKPVQYRAPLGFGSPSVKDCDPNTKMPTRIGLTFQVRIQITGSCKFRGARFKAVPVPETKYTVPQCKPLCAAIESAEACEPCVDIDTCIQFPLVLYNLNANKTYQNIALSVDVTCPDQTIQTVVVPAGTISYTMPFPPGFTGVFPPLVMNCLSGGVIVKTIPTGSTQVQIDNIVNAMINECVQAYAESIADCGPKIFSSEQVSVEHQCEEGTTLHFSGTLPSWIMLDTETSTVIGAAGAVTSTISVSDATEKALAQLNTWVENNLTSGNLSCASAPAFVVVIVPQDFGDIGNGAILGGPFSGIVYGYGNFDVYSTSNGGVTWTPLGSDLGPLDFGINCFGFGAGLFVVGMGGGQIATSPDAVTWTSQTSPTANGLEEIAFGAGVFVMVGRSGTIINSADGINWNDVSVIDDDFESLTFGGGKFVAVGRSGIIYTSPDGTTWTPQVSGTSERLLGVAYSGSVYVVVGRSGTLLTSPDAITWTPQAPPVADDLVAVGFGSGTFMLATDPGSAGDLYESTDGVTWTQNTSRTIGDNDKYVHVRFGINFIFATTFRAS